MAKFFGNAFSLQMVSYPCAINVQEVKENEIYDFLPIAEDGGIMDDENSMYFSHWEKELKSDIVSVVGHPDTARVLGVKFNRVSIRLAKGDVLYVAQLVGGRLPEGATTLPEGYSFKYLKVEVK